MNIVVCIKQVPDPEAVVDQYRVDGSGRNLVPAPGVAWVISPFDENAIEAALQIKEELGGKVTALTLGPDSALEALKRALHMGVDEAVLIQNPNLPEPQAQATAFLLAKAIQKIGDCDLILCGRQAADWDQGQVGCCLAEFLKIPALTVVSKIEPLDGMLRVNRLAEDGYEVMEVRLPALLTLTNEINQPRLTSVTAILRAAKIKIPVWTLSDLDVNPRDLEPLASFLRIEKLYIPEINRECVLIEGEDGVELAANLIKVLQENKAIADLIG